jgi:membrane associated rhomboid family serine protease
MQQPQPLARCFHYPITTSIAAMAILGTLRWWSGADITRFEIGSDGWWLEPWRLVTPVLFHADILHLIFNLYWFWLFGAKIEEEFGQGRTLGIYVLLAAGSCTAEQAIFYGGVGLSGVVYGLFGLLWVLESRDSRFRDVVDRQTVQVMVGWFFLCIVLTVTGALAVANVAHGVGYLLGALLGWTIGLRNFRNRVLCGAVLAGTTLLCITGGTVARPYVNFTKEAGLDFARRGYSALERGDNEKAVYLYRKAVAIDAQQWGYWNNLGIAYRGLHRMREADEAFDRAAALKPDEADRE